MVLVDAAAAAGVLERCDRLVPAIAEAGRSWSNLASRWGDLAPPGARLQEPLARAAAEVRAAYRQITHDKTTLASPEAIAGRPGLPEAVRAALRAIEAGSELAVVVAEKADAPDLIGPARALSRRAHNDVEAGFATPPAEGDVVWVSPTDILNKRLVPLPPPVAETLRAASDATIDATSSASAVATLHRGEHTPSAPDLDPCLQSAAVREVGRLQAPRAIGPRR
jgi:prophage DNA circulation protein